MAKSTKKPHHGAEVIEIPFDGTSNTVLERRGLTHRMFLAPPVGQRPVEALQWSFLSKREKEALGRALNGDPKFAAQLRTVLFDKPSVEHVRQIARRLLAAGL